RLFLRHKKGPGFHRVLFTLPSGLTLEGHAEVNVQVIVLAPNTGKVWLNGTLPETTVLIEQAQPGALPKLEVGTGGPGASTGAVVDPGVEVSGTQTPPVVDHSIVIKTDRV